MSSRAAIFLSAILACTSILTPQANAGTVVLDFENLSGPLAPIPAGYAGFPSWGSFASGGAASSGYVPSSGVRFTLSVGPAVPILLGQELVVEGASFSGPSPGTALWFELYLGGVLVHTSPQLVPSPTSVFLPTGYSGPVDEIRVETVVGNFYAMDDLTYSTIPVITDPSFRRGDANNDGGFDISDAIFLLGALFIAGSPETPCADAADINDDGLTDISDAVSGLSSLFIAGSAPPPAPGPTTCDVDPTVDALDCVDSNCP